MTSIDTYRQILGSDGDDLTDEQLRTLRETNIQLADILFELWLKERNTQAQPESTETEDES